MITKRLLCCGILVVICIFILHLNFNMWYHSPVQIRAETEVNETRVERKLIILLTEGRSGSTWLGTLFQRVEDLLYVFEPLDPRYVNYDYRKYAIAELSESGALSNESQLNILSSLCTCKFTDRLQAFGKAGAGHNVMSSITRYDLAENVLKGPQHMEEFCSRYTQVMAKCIRLVDLALIQHLPDTEYQCANFLVIHLVRDPRAVIRSRIVTFHELYAGNGHKVAPKNVTVEDVRVAAASLCRHGVANHVTSQEPWIRAKYLRLKYEDLVADPHGKLLELYRFINRPISTELSEYIDKTTTGTDARSNYQVIKDSAAVADKWKSMDPVRSSIIEENCREFMQIYGYHNNT